MYSLANFLALLLLATHFVGTTGQDPSTEYAGINKLLSEIARLQQPKCGIVAISDSHFRHYVIQWLMKLAHPMFVVSTDQNPKYIKSRNGTAIGWDSSGYFTCSYIVLCCQRKATCQTNNLDVVLTALDKAGWIRPVRRAFIYIESEVTKSKKTPSFKGRRADLIYHVIAVFRSVSPHITLIRKVAEEFSNGIETYKLVTFTPNWMPGGTPILSTLWSPTRGFQNYDNLKIKWKHLKKGGNLRIAIPNSNLLPLIQVNDDGTSTGIDDAVVKILTERFRISVDYNEVVDQQYGKKFKSGNWSGVIGAVMRKEADIGIGEMMFTYPRLRTGLQISNAIAILRATIVCPTPHIVGGWNDLITPFSLYVWICLFITLLLCLLVSTTLQRMIHRHLKVVRTKRLILWRYGKQPPKKSWFAWPYLIGPMLQKSIPLHLAPKRDGYRIFFGFWGIISFLLSSFYGSTLISKLSVPEMETPPENKWELLENSEDWMISGLVYQTIQDTTFLTEQKLIDGSFAVQTGGMGGDDDADDQADFNYVLKSRRCAIVERGRAKYMIYNHYTVVQPDGAKKRLLRWSKGSIVIGPAGWFIRGDVDFLFKRYIDRTMLMLQSSGILVKVGDEYAPENKLLQREENEIVTRAEPLSLDSLDLVFWLWIGGLGMASLVMLVELASFSLGEVNKMKRNSHEQLSIHRTIVFKA